MFSKGGGRRAGRAPRMRPRGYVPARSRMFLHNYGKTLPYLIQTGESCFRSFDAPGGEAGKGSGAPGSILPRYERYSSGRQDDRGWAAWTDWTGRTGQDGADCTGRDGLDRTDWTGRTDRTGRTGRRDGTDWTGRDGLDGRRLPIYFLELLFQISKPRHNSET